MSLLHRCGPLKKMAFCASIALVGIAILTGSGIAPADAATQQFHLTGDYEFTGNTVSSADWAIYNGKGGRPGIYTASHVSEGNGVISLYAKGGKTAGLCLCGTAIKQQTYGQWSVRAKVSNGPGYGPGILMWPQPPNTWPQGGEFDMLESPHSPRVQAQQNTHWGDDPHHPKGIGHNVPLDVNAYHVYSVRWTPGVVSYYIDGKNVYTLTNKKYPGSVPHTSMHLALQIDAGPPEYMGTPTAATKVTMNVDWVKVWSYSGR